MQPNQNAIIENFKIDWNKPKQGVINTLKYVMFQKKPDQYENLIEFLEKEWTSLIQAHETTDQTDLARLYRTIMTFKPALQTIIDPGQFFDEICDMAITSFNGVLDRIRHQLNSQKTPMKSGNKSVSKSDLKSPIKKSSNVILPGNNRNISLSFYCTICKETQPVPQNIQEQLLNSEETHSLPLHCGQEMTLQIHRSTPTPKHEPPTSPITVYPAEILMGHSTSTETTPEYLKIVSVGIDIGSSTSHLIFSRLTLKRETSFFNMSNRFLTINREILYESAIMMTPLRDRFTIDFDAIVTFCQMEYQKAGISPEMVDTGAVIVTGETAKKENAAEIVQRLSSKTGKFVSASAGPNFESVLGAMGSGAVDYSKKQRMTIMNIDIGGGTSNLAIVSHGEILSTSCINVGGRLLGIDKQNLIWRLDEPTERVMHHLGLTYQLGDRIAQEHLTMIVHAYATALLEVMVGPARNPLVKSLMMTANLDFTLPIQGIMISGGIGKFIYGTPNESYNDIGVLLAAEIKTLIQQHQLTLIEPKQKIRATVIGAGAYSLSISGSTCYYDPQVILPLENIPVVSISVTLDDLQQKFSSLKKKITTSLQNYDLQEGRDQFALYFQNPVIRSDLGAFAKIIEAALPNSVKQESLILVILGSDGGKMLGITLKNETSIQTNLFCLDELELHAGDWIDIGKPFSSKSVFPVTVKSLVFHQERKTE